MIPILYAVQINISKKYIIDNVAKNTKKRRSVLTNENFTENKRKKLMA